MEKAVGIGTRVVQREKIGWKGGAGMDEKKKERKGKRAMKPRRKNGINSLPFCRVGQKKYSDLYCLKILFDKSAKIFIITYGFINFLLTKKLHESKIQISSGRKKVQRKWRGRGSGGS